MSDYSLRHPHSEHRLIIPLKSTKCIENIIMLFRVFYCVYHQLVGMTSEGGGSVAFPIMTLAFSISPIVARDFSLGIQSCGMTAAAFTILWMRIQLEWNSIIFCSLGGLFGIVFGLEWIDPNLTPPQKKMGFVSVWFSFAFALFLLNRYHKRKTFTTIPEFKTWKAIVLIATGRSSSGFQTSNLTCLLSPYNEFLS